MGASAAACASSGRRDGGICARWPRADLRSVALSGADLSRARLTGANLEGVEVAYLQLHGADLSGGRLTRASLPGANLFSAKLCRTQLGHVDLRGADLRKADFTGAIFHMGSTRSGMIVGAPASWGTRTGFYVEERPDLGDLLPQDVRVADLRGADLREAVVLGTDFYRVDLRGAIFDPDQAAWFRRSGAILNRPRANP